MYGRYYQASERECEKTENGMVMMGRLGSELATRSTGARIGMAASRAGSENSVLWPMMATMADRLQQAQRAALVLADKNRWEWWLWWLWWCHGESEAFRRLLLEGVAWAERIMADHHATCERRTESIPDASCRQIGTCAAVPVELRVCGRDGRYCSNCIRNPCARLLRDDSQKRRCAHVSLFYADCRRWTRDKRSVEDGECV